MLQELNLAGTVIILYDVFNTLAGIVLLGFILLQTAKYRELLPNQSRNRGKRTLAAFGQLLLIGVLLYAVLSYLNQAFAKWFTNGNANYYGNLTAWLIVVSVIPILFKVDPRKVMDLLSPGLPLCLFVAKVACFFYGCCSGFELPGSFYFNQDTGRPEVPVQMIEALVALALFFYLLWYKKRIKLTGSVFPIYLLFYSVSRFFTEFLRADLPDILGPFNAYQVLSIIFALNGLIFLMTLRIYGERIGMWFIPRQK